jgi:hypothetical protein
MNKVSINAAQQRYVIDCGEGYTCLGFANARDHANQIACRLGRADLAFTDEDYATLAGYEKYGRAVQAWSQSSANTHDLLRFRHRCQGRQGPGILPHPRTEGPPDPR